MTSIPGIDVSAIGQGLTFNWGGWRGKLGFAWGKASQGLTFADQAYTANQRGAASIGVRFGAYHVLQGADDGAAQAHWFLKCANPRPGDLVGLDYEPSTTDGQSAARLSAEGGAFADVIRSELGCWPFVYSDITMIVSGALASLGACPLWLANPSRIPTPNGIGPWKLISMEQTGQRGVDTDTFYGTGEQLMKLSVVHAAGSPTPPPPPPPPALEHSWRLVLTSSPPSFVAITSTDGGKTWR